MQNIIRVVEAEGSVTLITVASLILMAVARQGGISATGPHGNCYNSQF